MKTSAPAVVACASCGSLHSPAPGERDLCPACRKLLPAEPPWRTARPGSASGQPIGASTGRPGRPRAIGRGNLRRAAIAAAIACTALGAAAAIPRNPVSDAWSTVRRHSAAGAWASVQRSARDVWIAIRARAPFGASEVDRNASVAPAKPPDRHVRLSPPAAVPGRRSHTKAPARKRTTGDGTRAGSAR